MKSFEFGQKLTTNEKNDKLSDTSGEHFDDRSVARGLTAHTGAHSLP